MSVSSDMQTVPVKRNWMDVLAQLLRFSIVGGLNTCIDLIIFNILAWAFPTHHIHRLVFYNSLAYLLGAANSFCWNRLWTFEQRSKVTGAQVARFAFVTGLGILCNDVLLWLVTSLLAVSSISGFLWTNIAKLTAIAGTVAVSFVGMRFGVFLKDEQEVITFPPPANPQIFITPRSLSVILPAYNEEVVIAQTLVTSIAALNTWLRDFEVIVVNDGSRDRTGEIIAYLAAYDRRIRLIDHPMHEPGLWRGPGQRLPGSN